MQTKHFAILTNANGKRVTFAGPNGCSTERTSASTNSGRRHCHLCVNTMGKLRRANFVNNSDFGLKELIKVAKMR